MRFDIVLLVAILAGIVLWLEMLRMRERALTAARQLCQRHDVQLLDETVGLSALRLRRRDGRLGVQRRYSFEVSRDGHDRHHGHLWLDGDRVVSVSTSWPAERDASVIDFTPVSARRRLSDRSGDERTPPRPNDVT